MCTGPNREKQKRVLLSRLLPEQTSSQLMKQKNVKSRTNPDRPFYCLRALRSGEFHIVSFTLIRARTHGQKRTQICDPLPNKCSQGHDSVSKTWEIYLTRGHLFDRDGHLCSEGSQFCFKLLGGQSFDHVCEPLKKIEGKHPTFLNAREGTRPAPAQFRSPKISRSANFVQFRNDILKLFSCERVSRAKHESIKPKGGRALRRWLHSRKQFLKFFNRRMVLRL